MQKHNMSFKETSWLHNHSGLPFSASLPTDIRVRFKMLTLQTLTIWSNTSLWLIKNKTSGRMLETDSIFSSFGHSTSKLLLWQWVFYSSWHCQWLTIIARSWMCLALLTTFKALLELQRQYFLFWRFFGVSNHQAKLPQVMDSHGMLIRATQSTMKAFLSGSLHSSSAL